MMPIGRCSYWPWPSCLSAFRSTFTTSRACSISNGTFPYMINFRRKLLIGVNFTLNTCLRIFNLNFWNWLLNHFLENLIFKDHTISFGFSQETSSWLFSSMGLASCIGRLIVGKVIDEVIKRWGTLRIIYVMILMNLVNGLGISIVQKTYLRKNKTKSLQRCKRGELR